MFRGNSLRDGSMNEEILNQICQIVAANSGTNKTFVQMIAIICLTALAISAMVIDGSMGQTIAISSAGVVGTMAGWLFGKKVTT